LHLQGDGISIDKRHDSDKLDLGSSTKSHEVNPVKIGASAAPAPSPAAQTKSASHGGSGETSCVLSDVLTDQDIDWKLDIEDIKSRNTLKTLERIKQ